MIISLLENAIELFPKLKEKYCTDHVLFDFCPGDFVKYTLKNGSASMLKVCDIQGEYISAVRIDGIGEKELIKPKFLKKTEIDPKWVRTLYRSK